MRRRSGRFFALLGGWRRRQNSGIYHDFCLLRGPRKPISEAAVDKNYAFYSVFVYFGGARGPAAVEFVRIRGRRQRPTHIASDPGGGRSTRRMLFASVHKQVSALRTSVQDWSSVYSSAGITNKLGMRHCIFMKQKSTSANSNVLFKTIQNVCLACKETGPARLGEFHR